MSEAYEKVVLTIWSDGDRFVGIDGDNAELVLSLPKEPEERKSQVEFLRGHLASMFAMVWDIDKRYIHVATEAELKQPEDWSWDFRRSPRSGTDDDSQGKR